MESPVVRWIAALAFAGLLGPPALAQEAAVEGGDKVEIAKVLAEIGKKKEEEKLPKLEEVVKEMEKIDGLLTLYRKQNRLLALLTRKQLEKPFLLATSVAAGGMFAGWQWADMMVQFERHDRKVLLVRPDTQYRAGEKAPIHGAVTRTHPGEIVAALDAEAEDGQGGVLVSLSDLYTKQAEALVGSLARSRDASLSRLQKVKNFPQNVEVAVDLVERLIGGRHGSILTVHYSLSALPEKATYAARIADDRIGYFLTVVKDYDRDYRADTSFVRYVNRWQLEKADPDLDLSPPKEPIVFHVEKTVPTRFRRWVQEGILEWNKAFEKVGFVGAMVVRQQTETQFADLDPEDVRYNFFRWITSDMPFAMGPSRVDPRTGQILDADIIFDDSMVRAYFEDWDLMVEEAMAESFTPADERFFGAHPAWDPLARLRRSRTPDGPEPRPDLATLTPALGPPTGPSNEPPGSGRKFCNIGRGRSRQMALGAIALGLVSGDEEKGEEKKKREWPEEFVGQIVKEIVMHEVGHTLGLRHNFKASSWRPFSEINTEARVADISASVMDYNPLNVAPPGAPQGVFAPTTIGPYDHWAIEYGYKPIKAGGAEAETEELGKIAARAAEPGHDYATDEDLWIADPLTNLWDYGKDPLEYASARAALVRKLKDEVIERVVEEGREFAGARRAMSVLMSELGGVCYTAAGHVGGTYFHRDHRGDPGARDPIVVVPADKQRAALHLLRDLLFSANAFDVSPELLRKLAPSRWSHWGTYTWGDEASFPLHDLVLSLQSWSLYRVMAPDTVRRIADGEMATAAGEDALTIPELVSTLSEAIFAEIPGKDGKGRAVEAAARRFTNRRPFLNGIRRNLQREYVGRLIDLALAGEETWYPKAARTLAWWHLRDLKDRLDRVLDDGAADRLDDYSRSHLEESRERIARALEATFTLAR